MTNVILNMDGIWTKYWHAALDFSWTLSAGYIDAQVDYDERSL